ncbi:MAG: acyltransferase [Candidatus Daviesbacteria bacterium]|nr:acyltransferase [Candidatus Daviesbacteria bacterium]
MPIQIQSAEIQTQIFIAILVLAILIGVARRKESISLDVQTSNELKGVGILMVVFAHIGYFLVSDHRFLFPISVGGGIGVNLFFFLSGYGLTISSLRNKLSILDFYKKRIIKLFIPMWMILILFFTLDFFILNRGYSLIEIIQSFLGYFPKASLIYNVNSPLWFITPILFYYFIFPLIFNKKYLSLVAVLLMGSTYLLLFSPFIRDLLVNNNLVAGDVLRLYKTHFIAFPLGIITADLATNNSYTRSLWTAMASRFRNHLNLVTLFRIITIILAAYITGYTAIYSGVGKPELIEQNISMITTISIIYLFSFNFFRFRLLGLLGIFSYEIYLLHWPILSRFDLLYKNFPPAIATVLYLVLFLILGYLLDKISNLASNIFSQKKG